MQTLLKQGLFALTATCGLVTLGTPASAAIMLNGGGTVSGAGQIFTDGTVSVRVTAWSIHSDDQVYDAALGVYSSGLGVTNDGETGSSPGHTVDNVGNKDFLILQFSEPVVLDMATFKAFTQSNSDDTDAAIGHAHSFEDWQSQLALNNTPLVTLTNTFSNGHIYGSGSAGQSGDSTRNINPDSYAGNLWLVSASNPALAPVPDSKADSFKLKSITYSMPVPEPTTWALVIGGFGLAGGALRRKSARANSRAVMVVKA